MDHQQETYGNARKFLRCSQLVNMDYNDNNFGYNPAAALIGYLLLKGIGRTLYGHYKHNFMAQVGINQDNMLIDKAKQIVSEHQALS